MGNRWSWVKIPTVPYISLRPSEDPAQAFEAKQTVPLEAEHLQKGYCLIRSVAVLRTRGSSSVFQYSMAQNLVGTLFFRDDWHRLREVWVFAWIPTWGFDPRLPVEVWSLSSWRSFSNRSLRTRLPSRHFVFGFRTCVSIVGHWLVM